MKSLTAKQAGLAVAAAVLTGFAVAAGPVQAGLLEREAAGMADFSIRLSEPSQAVIAAPKPEDRYLNMNELLVLLRDADPIVRKAALRSSRNLIANSRVYEQIMEMMHDRGEEPGVRLEAARTLSYASQYNRVHEALAETARNSTGPSELRIMAYKALWSSANGDSRIQQFLIDSVWSEKEPAIRRAVIWAMFDSTRNNRTRDLLIGLLWDRKEDEATKIEIIKSLYTGMVHQETQDVVMAVINDPAETKQVKIAALYSLSGVSGSRVQRFLEDVMRYSRDPELRGAAVEAISPSLQRMREYFHLSYALTYGGIVNPIEKE